LDTIPSVPESGVGKGEELLPECLAPKLKGKRVSIMVWACFTGGDVSQLVVFEKGGIGTDEYIMTLEASLLPFIEQLHPGVNNGDTITVINENGYLFMQDGAPCHTSKKASHYLKQKRIPLMVWPANSPDLNPIENLWRDFNTRFHKYFTDTKSQLSLSQSARERYSEGLKKVWAEQGSKLATRLVESMPRQVQAVLATKGGHTKY
jgi:hypothetical protein